MDRKRSVLNVASAIISKLVLLVAAFLVRRLLISHLGNYVNGLNSLYSSIIGILGVAELGIGRAIAYSMYKPVLEKDENQVSALYYLYKRLYFKIGCAVLGLGIAVMPFLNLMIKDYKQISVSVYGTFFLTLVSVVLSYLYSANISLIEAYKDNYITTGILTISSLIRYFLQIIAILLWESYPIFIICQIITTLLTWLLCEAEVRRKHNGIISHYCEADKATKAEITKNAKAMFMHKVGSILVSTVDNVIISTFIGVTVLGTYSNYSFIAGALAVSGALFFTPLTSVVGHLCAGNDREKMREYFNYFFCMNYIIGVIVFLGYYAVIDYVIRVCFGNGLDVSRAIAFVITLNQFVSFMRNTALLFRNASGAFYYDRWKPVAEGLCNLALSLVFVFVFPEELRIVGVIVATIITTLLICDIVDPFVVFKHVFQVPIRPFYFRYYAYVGVFILALVAMTGFVREYRDAAWGIVINGGVALVVASAALVIVAVIDREFCHSVREIWSRVMGRNDG